MKKYIIRTLGMLGQLYDENGEEVHLPNGTELYLVADVEPPRKVPGEPVEASGPYGAWDDQPK